MDYSRKIHNLIISLTLFFIWITPVAADSPPVVQTQTSQDLIYTVQPGDTLLLVALKYNLNPAEIALVNQLPNPNLIFPGQQLVLPGIPAPTVAPNPQIGDKIHVIQPGETINSIAKLYNLPAGTLITLNNIHNPDLIEAGQTLQIPGESPIRPGPLEAPFTSAALSEPVII